MKKILCVSVSLWFILSCAHQKVETSKTIYENARAAQAENNEVQAIADWKAVVEIATSEIEHEKFLTSNYFLRASAYFELGEWEKGFQDLKNVQPESLSEQEYWIYPLYAVLMGDYYSQRNMTSVAHSFYQSVLKKSSWKASSVYLLALERDVNNSIKAVNLHTENQPDGEKVRLKEYNSIAGDIEKYLEEVPFQSVPHFLIADLYAKTGKSEEALEHELAALELGLPTHDLRQSAEYQLAQLANQNPIPSHLKSAFLDRAFKWWSGDQSDSLFLAAQDTVDHLRETKSVDLPDVDAATKIRYVAVKSGSDYKILIWEKVQ